MLDIGSGYNEYNKLEKLVKTGEEEIEELERKMKEVSENAKKEHQSDDDDAVVPTITRKTGGGFSIYLNTPRGPYPRHRLSRWLAANKPGPQSTNAGITPEWFLELVSTVTTLRDSLATEEL